MNLRVAMFEADIVWTFSCSVRTSASNHGLRDVDSQRTSGSRAARSFARRLPRPAADVEDVLMAANGRRFEQRRVVCLQFGLEIHGALVRYQSNVVLTQ